VQGILGTMVNPAFGSGPMEVVLGNVVDGEPDLAGVDEPVAALTAAGLLCPRMRPA